MRPHDDFLAPDKPATYDMPAPIPHINLRFPNYQFREYPKAALQKATADYVERFLTRHENFDERVQKMRSTRRPPSVKPGRESIVPLLDEESGEPIVFYSPTEEDEFYANHPHIERIDPAASADRPVAMGDEEFEAFQAFRAARQEGLRQSGLFASVAEEKQSLLERAEKLGVKVDKRWNHDTLRTIVIAEERKRAPADNPQA